MKIFIHHYDGTYSAQPIAAASYAAGLDVAAYIAANAIDMPESEWEEYQAFQEQARRWHNRLRDLDNEVYHRSHP